ncbi:sensor histidine kinase [Gracilimonas mengyeensis]|uniref:histidine kinase n=1 Tax=Gracilimonas mengyeensis TaxID=1302730 RepID=A0A521EFV8_9BACT|nr:histidine kinase dimerization/phosphoacceptor domain -containing protein [Gracilimonas mengyeensis]SMO82050.1 PAS domain S-box-containing protein [Gracilimonas mengyeensis]
MEKPKPQKKSFDNEKNTGNDSKEVKNAGSSSNKLKEILSEGIATDKLIRWASAHSGKPPKKEGFPNSMFNASSLPATEEDQKGLRNHEKLEKALEFSPSMVLILDRWGNIEYGNPSFLEVTGYNQYEIKGKEAVFLTSGMSLTPQIRELKNAIEKGLRWKGELHQVKKCGDPYFFSGKLDPLENDYGFITGFILTGQDVTSFRDTEEKLEKAIKEKNIVLAELHHRVKNNLAIVSGLMQLQAFNEENEYVQGRLFASAGRIKSLASMHEVLYESESLQKIEIAPIMNKIIHTVREYYKGDQLNIEIVPRIEPVELNVNQAHPCSLILNEIISNAFKHAFEQQKEGLIEIRVFERDNTVHISITDDGKGFADNYKNMASQKHTTGYELLNSLVNQLGGSYSYCSKDGKTRFMLQFEKEDTNGAQNANLKDWW